MVGLAPATAFLLLISLSRKRLRVWGDATTHHVAARNLPCLAAWSRCLGETPSATSPKLVELEGAAEALDSLQQRLARERGDVLKDIRPPSGVSCKAGWHCALCRVVALHGCDALREAAV